VFLVHGQVTIIFVVSVGLSVCLFVCLFLQFVQFVQFVQFFSAVFDPISVKLGHMLCVGSSCVAYNIGAVRPLGAE